MVKRGLLGGSEGKESACSVRDLSSVPGLVRSPGEGNGYPLQYSFLARYNISDWTRNEVKRIGGFGSTGK